MTTSMLKDCIIIKSSPDHHHIITVCVCVCPCDTEYRRS
jgi:hypothetical protein